MTWHDTPPPNCQHMNHGIMTLLNARGQSLSTPSPIFSSILPTHQPPPPQLSSCLINGPVCFTRNRQGAWRRDKTIISLTAAAHAGAPTADRILKQAAVLAQIATQPVLASPLSEMYHCGGTFRSFPLGPHTDFLSPV